MLPLRPVAAAAATDRMWDSTSLRTSPTTRSASRPTAPELRDLLALPADPHWLDQAHGNRILDLDLEPGRVDADAAYTASAGRVCAVQSADCLSLLLCNFDGTEIAAVHAGWRGLLAEIIGAAVARFKSEPEALMAWLGPAICVDHYEVSGDIQARFAARNRAYADAFSRRGPQHHLDLTQVARIQLAQCGVTRVYGGGQCTFARSDDYYSYRRDRVTGPLRYPDLAPLAPPRPPPLRTIRPIRARAVTPTPDL